MAQSKKTVASFEESLDQLQRAVRDLESGGLTLTDSLSRYELGVQHLRQCLKLLEQTELKIRQLVDVDENGNALLESFEHQRSAQSDDSPSAGKKRKRVAGEKRDTAARRDADAAGEDDPASGDCDNLF